MADALRVQGYYHEALRFYEPLQQVAEYADTSCFDAMGTCYQALELYDEAEDCYRVVVENEPENIEVYTKMAKMFESAGMLERARPYVSKIGSIRQQLRCSGKQKDLHTRPTIQAPRRVSEELEDGPLPNMLEPAPPRKSISRPISNKRVREEENQEQIHLLFLQAVELREQMQAGEDYVTSEWKGIASLLIESFKKKKAFFPLDKSIRYVSKTVVNQGRKGKVDEAVDEVELMAKRLQVSLGITLIQSGPNWTSS